MSRHPGDPPQRRPDSLHLAPERRTFFEQQPVQREPLRPSRPDQRGVVALHGLPRLVGQAPRPARGVEAPPQGRVGQPCRVLAREVGPKEGPPRRPQRRGPDGPLLTIGDTLADGPRGVRVSCLAARPNGWRCHHQGLVDLDCLGLSPELPYAHIPGRRVLRCSRCGSRDVSVMPDWPDPQEMQKRRMSDGAAPVQVLNGVVLSIKDGGRRDT